MNILIDINHPAHVHLLRNVYKMLVEDGNKVYVAVKEIPSAMRLLDLYGVPYINIGKKDDALGKKVWISWFTTNDCMVLSASMGLIWV